MIISNNIPRINFILVASVLARLASAPTANLSYFLLAYYASRGRAQAIQSLVFSWFFSMINSGISPVAAWGDIGRLAVLLSAAGTVLLSSSDHSSREKLASSMTCLLGSFLVFHSIFISPMLDVSVLKAFSWSLAMITIISAWSSMSEDEKSSTSNFIYYVLVAILLVSVPLLLTSPGYGVIGTGFQGVLNQPQAFGLTIALLGAWTAGIMFQQRPPSWYLIFVFFLSLVLIFLSEARTAGVSLVIGLIISCFINSGTSLRSSRSSLPGLFSKRFQLILSIGLVGSVLAGAAFSSLIGGYLANRTDSSNLVEAYSASRGDLMHNMLINIEKYPFLGHGFGIASDTGSMLVKRDPFFGLPISATVEKGVLPLAVLEEVGIFGFLAVSAWVFMLLKRSVRGGLAPVIVAVTVFLLNMGEATLFSVNGMGLLPLVLLGWSFSSVRSHSAQ